MGKPKVMIALRDAEHVEDLVRLGCQMADGMGAEISALHVVEVGPGLPLDAEAEVLDRPGKELLEKARQVAGEILSKAVSTRLVRAREAGEAIVGEAMDQSTDLLILGYRHKHGVTETLFGSTVRYVAHHAPCCILVQILPRTQ